MRGAWAHLRTATEADLRAAQPEVTYFWGPRAGDWTDATLEDEYKKDCASDSGWYWTIALEGNPVGFIGLVDIDWIRRQGESFIFIGAHEVYRKGIATEAIRLRTQYAFRELNLHRVYNWVAYDNVGNRRANEKAGYQQQGVARNLWRRGPRFHDVWARRGSQARPARGST